jgi:murein DD-endopeptidase MepM/ murein hydrolase activator NlpD
MISCFKGKFKVTSPRGNRTLKGKKEYHGGIDLVALGTDKTVYAIADGTVDATPYEANGFGYYVRQILADGQRIYYGHLKAGSISVKAGQKIKKGDKLGIMGATGNVTGAHTHLELRPKGTTGNSLDICEFTGLTNKVGSYIYKEEKPMLTSANDIVWELNHTYFPITETAKFIKELEEAKVKNSSLYWGYYKLVNKIK